MKKSLAFLLILSLGVFLTSCEEAPTPVFEYTIDGKYVEFINMTEGQVDEYLWSFGDGNTSNEENPSHTYETGGDKIVTLVVRNDKGANETTQTISIEGGGNGTVTLPEIEGADALLVAVNNSTFTEQAGYIIEAKLGLAAGAFYDENQALVDVGRIVINGTDLEKGNGNYYSYYELNAKEFTAPVNWEVEGGNGFEAISSNSKQAFPQMSRITSGNVNTTSDYQLTFETAITDADSVIILISGASNTYQEAFDLDTKEYTIPADKLSDLGATENGLISVSAYTYEKLTVGDKNVYMVNQGNVTKTIRVE